MSASRERFIQLALRPLRGRGQAEDDAAAELSARLHHAGDDPALLADAVARLEECHPPPAWCLPVIVCGVIAFLAVVLAFIVPDHREEGQILEAVLQGRGESQQHFERVLHSMGSAGEKVPLRSHYYLQRNDFRKQLDLLLEQHPGDKAVYRYQASWKNRWNLSAVDVTEFMEKWNRLDPGNAYWGIELGNSISRTCITHTGHSLVVHNERNFEEALLLLSEAARRDHCSSHFSRIHELQLASFVPESTLRNWYVRKSLQAMTACSRHAEVHWISWLVSVQAERLADQGDREGLRSLLGDYHEVLLLVARDRTTSPYFIMEPLRTMSALKEACKKLDLVEEIEWMEKVETLRGPFATSLHRALEARRQTGLLHSTFIQAGALSAGELKPGRMVEYAVADRFMALAVVLLVFPIIIGASLEMLRRGRAARGLARGLSPLFRSSDFLWIFGLGLLVPLAWWIVVVRYTPFGGRDLPLFSPHYLRKHMVLQLWLLHGLGGFVLVVSALYQTARWRWAKRGAMISFNSRGMWIGWSMVIFAALFIPVIGPVRGVFKGPLEYFIGGAAAAAIPLLWLLWRVCMGLFTSKENSLQGLLTLRAMLPGLMAMVVLLLAAIPLLRMEERGWVEGDVLLKPAPDGSGLSFAESREYDLLRPQLIKALEGDGRGVESP